MLLFFCSSAVNRYYSIYYHQFISNFWYIILCFFPLLTFSSYTIELFFALCKKNIVVINSSSTLLMYFIWRSYFLLNNWNLWDWIKEMRKLIYLRIYHALLVSIWVLFGFKKVRKQLFFILFYWSVFKPFHDSRKSIFILICLFSIYPPILAFGSSVVTHGCINDTLSSWKI